MRFTIDAKELKAMMDKVKTVIPKRAAVTWLQRLYFEIKDNQLILFGTDIEQYLHVRTDNVIDVESGSFGIDLDDIKILSKMTGDITIITSEDDSQVTVKNGKKILKLVKYGRSDLDISIPEVECKNEILKTSETWMFETVNNLFTFTSNDSANGIYQCLNFNSENKKAEACNGCRITTRTIPDEMIIDAENFMLHNMCVPVLKRILDKKAGNNVFIYQDEKYIRVEGTDFTYHIRRVNGKFIDVSRLIDCSEKTYEFTVNKLELLNTAKYAYSLLNGKKKPLVIRMCKDGLQTLLQTKRHEVFDEVGTENVDLQDELYFGIDPLYLTEALNIIDVDNPVFSGNDNKNPMIIQGNEYKFAILPVNLGDYNSVKIRFEKFNQDRVA